MSGRKKETLPRSRKKETKASHGKEKKELNSALKKVKDHARDVILTLKKRGEKGSVSKEKRKKISFVAGEGKEGNSPGWRKNHKTFRTVHEC